jgi:hypothetical protein
MTADRGPTARGRAARGVADEWHLVSEHEEAVRSPKPPDSCVSLPGLTRARATRVADRRRRFYQLLYGQNTPPAKCTSRPSYRFNVAESPHELRDRSDI